ncbi:MAG: flagellar biosynthesis protein FlgN [Treponema sp.]|nr:flagellar biosynthesis protein FlgN [Treponema sp.]
MSTAQGSIPMEVITDEELQSRIAVVKRFKELLQAQRDRFETYLNALDQQMLVIQNGNTDDLLRHVELEEMIVSDIFSIQKVIDPLETMFHSARSSVSAAAGDEVMGLKEALEGLKTEAVQRSGQNRELLALRMAEIRNEIKTLKSNVYARRRPAFASVSPGQIDIQG